MTKKRLLLFGGGGHCASCLDVIRSTEQYEVVGVIDKFLRRGDIVGTVPVVGADDDAVEWLAQSDEVLITLGMVDRSDKRKTLYGMLHDLGATFATVISPRAYVSSEANVGHGTIIMHDALVNSGAIVGQNSIINTKALIEHGARVGNHCHVSTRATLNGDAIINDNVLIGSHGVVFPGCDIGANSVVGGGQVIKRSVKDGYHPNLEKRW